MAEFSPTELDRLEDALETLSGPEPGALSEEERAMLSAAATARLAEYDELLVAARDVFVDEDPPPAALAGIMAEARAAVESSVRPSTTASAWTRWRAVLVPAFVLAGSAAAVLLFLRPGERPEPSPEIARATAPSTTAAVLPATPAVVDRIEEPDAPTAEAEDTAETAPGDEAGREQGDASPGAPAPAELPSPRSKKTSSPAPAKASAPEPAPAKVGKEEGWDELERAHTLRRRGDCERAAAIYGRLAASTLGEAGRAQAHAGKGLCEELAGDAVAAQRSFSDARRLTPEIDRWIASQRASTASTEGPKSKPSAKTKASRKSRSSKADLMDAFDG